MVSCRDRSAPRPRSRTAPRRGGANAPQGQNNPALPPPPAPTGTNNGGLKVEQKGVPAICSPTAGTCEFEVTITNTTAAPVTGPLKVFDTLSVGTQSQAKNVGKTTLLPPGLTCLPQGNEFNCTQDPLTLAVGASLTFRAAFTIDTTEGGAANFVTNKAVVAFGPLAGEATASIAFDEPLNKLPDQVPGDAQAVPRPPRAQPLP